MNARTRARWGRLTVLVAVFSLALAACASPSRSGSAAPDAEAETTAPATRTLGHALGTAAIPIDPRRIVVLNQYLPLDALVALGVQPVGSTGDPAAGYPFALWLQGRTEGVEMVGSTEEPDLEHIAPRVADRRRVEAGS